MSERSPERLARMAARALLVSAALAAAWIAPSVAMAQARSYRGPHPVDHEGHWHVEDTVHVHDELVVGEEPFGDLDGVLVFLADPLAYGWDRDVWTYAGAHPLPGGIDGYCGVSGEHRHPFAPEGSFRRADHGVYVFTGAMRGGVRTTRPGRVVPRHPIMTADAPPGVNTTPGLAPFWVDGCLHRLVLDGGGAMSRVPLGGCVPRRGSLGRRHGVARGRGHHHGGGPSPAPSVTSGQYGGFVSPPTRASVRVARPRQPRR